MQQTIRQKFEEMGARVRLVSLAAARRAWNGRRTLFGAPVSVEVDIGHDSHGEYFEIRRAPAVRLDVLDVQRGDQHLLLTARAAGESVKDASKFLCGFDERSWFVAAIPEAAAVADVQDAKDALKPEEVWQAMREYGVPSKDRDKRRTWAFVRQGEWFFIPRPAAQVSQKDVLRNEPIQRGAGKAHMCQFLYRDGGEVVYVCDDFPDGLSVSEYQELRDRMRYEPWREMRRNARVLVRGNIRHPDHATVSLGCWHEVVMNTESRAKAMQHVAFLD